MPNRYDIEYVIHACSSSPQEQEWIRHNWTYEQAIKEIQFRNYDDWVQSKQYE